jgi:DNA (cytosine-5)-methyltransferase 3A
MKSKIKPINVLSLFDGISCGQVALKRVSIPVLNYYASEIDPYTISITQKNFPKTIQLGDVIDWKSWKLPKIDLLMGGSPCQGFSFAGNRLNFDDHRSKLFFEFVDILNFYKPKYFLLENVKMKKEWVNIINDHIGVSPIEIDSALVSAQTRKRLYWTNIPGIKQPNDRKKFYNKVLYRLPHGYITEETKLFSKYPTLVAQSPGTKYREVVDKNTTRVISPEECEKLQTLPKNYTKGIPKTRRYAAIGNGWTVDVIAHIFRGMKKCLS